MGRSPRASESLPLGLRDHLSSSSRSSFRELALPDVHSVLARGARLRLLPRQSRTAATFLVSFSCLHIKRRVLCLYRTPVYAACQILYMQLSVSLDVRIGFWDLT